MPDRPLIDVPSPVGGWGQPWPNVAEVEAVLPHESWTLVGGLMTQLHATRRGIDVLRATDDVDMVLHVETTRGVASHAATALESIGYQFTPSIDARTRLGHRFKRGRSTVDLLTGDDVVDVLVADHAPPRVVPKLRGHAMVTIEGGTQALRRTVNVRLQILPDSPTILSVPSSLGAVILKAAAHQVDSRDRSRHLLDAAVLLATIDDPYGERERLAGSDRGRLLGLARALDGSGREWERLPEPWRTEAQTALRLLTATEAPFGETAPLASRDPGLTLLARQEVAAGGTQFGGLMTRSHEAAELNCS